MRRVMGLGVVAAALCGGCGDEPRLSVLEAKVFAPSCAYSTCHGGDRPVRGLDLRAGAVYGSTVGVVSPENGQTRVVPFDPEASLLLNALKGRAPDTRPMPPGSSLSQDKLDLVRRWIEAGAPDN